MKVLVAVHRYPPQVGGSERVASEIVAALSGHDVVVATQSCGSPRHDPGVRFAEFSTARGRLLPSEVERYRALFAEDFDVRLIYAGQSWQLDAVADLIGSPSLRGVTVLAPVGMSKLGWPGWSEYYAKLVETMRRCDALVFHSKEYQDYRFAKLWLGGEGPELVVVPNAADLVNVRTSDRPFDVMTASSHLTSKGHRYLRQLSTDHPWKVAVVAPSPGLTSVRACDLACSYRDRISSNFTLIPGDDPNVVGASLPNAKCFYLPSSVECSPLVIFEAMAAATPWVSFDVGNVAELPGGIVVDSHREADEVLSALLNDEGRRRALGEQGRAAIEHRYNWPAVRQRYAELIESLA